MSQNDSQSRSTSSSSNEEEKIMPVPFQTETPNVDYDPALGEFDGQHYTIVNSVFGPGSSEHSKMECNFKKKSQCKVLRKGKQVMSDEDNYLYTCALCDKCIHLDCYNAFITDNDLTHIVKELNISLVCGKRCYQKVKKELFDLANKKAKTVTENPKFWDNDGEPLSLEILLDWITDERNSDKYFGAKDSSSKNGFSIEDGISKLGLCKQISELIWRRMETIARPTVFVQRSMIW